jgi:hypothetical protein
VQLPPPLPRNEAPPAAIGPYGANSPNRRTSSIAPTRPRTSSFRYTLYTYDIDFPWGQNASPPARTVLQRPIVTVLDSDDVTAGYRSQCR